MLGTSGLQKEPVKFRVYKPILGIPEHCYVSGTYETRKLTEICMLRRLPKDHVEELTEEFVETMIPEEPLPQENPSPPPENSAISEMRWHELRSLGLEKGVFTVGMTREEVEMALSKLEEPAVEGFLRNEGLNVRCDDNT